MQACVMGISALPFSHNKKTIKNQGYSMTVEYHPALERAFGKAVRLSNVPYHPSPKIYAFDPDDLEVGSIVSVRMKKAVKEYTKDDYRFMLVTGLWRRGENIEKIEMFNFTTVPGKKEYPDDFYLNTTQVGRSGAQKQGRMSTSCMYLFDNSPDIFPMHVNKELRVMGRDLWPEILARRAYSIMYNPFCRMTGTPDFSLTREGFTFPSMPQSAIRTHDFIPEVAMKNYSSKPCDILNAEQMEAIAAFTVSLTERMLKRNGHTYFTIPHIEDWPDEIEAMDYPDWQRAENAPRVGSLIPQLA